MLKMARRGYGIYTWAKKVRTGIQRTRELTLRAKLMIEYGRDGKVWADGLIVQIYLDNERQALSGASLAEEYKLLKEWTHTIFM